jgi:hypothetical protein
VYVDISGKEIIISCDKKETNTSISIDISGMDKISALHYIQAVSRYGYDEIEILFKNTTLIQYPQNTYSSVSSLVQYIVNRLVGLEIVEQQEHKIVIKRIINESNSDFEQVLRRIFFMVEELVLVFNNASQNLDITSLKTIKERHDHINNLTNYCLRILNKNGATELKDTLFYYHIIADIDKIVDVYKYLATDIIELKKELSPIAIKCFNYLNENLKLYSNLFYSFSTSKVSELNKNRWKVKTYILDNSKKVSTLEMMHMTRIEAINEYLLDMTEARMAIQKKS